MAEPVERLRFRMVVRRATGQTGPGTPAARAQDPRWGTGPGRQLTSHLEEAGRMGSRGPWRPSPGGRRGSNDVAHIRQAGEAGP